MTNKERFEYYINNKHDVWLSKLTWKGMYGDMPKYSTNLIKFLSQCSSDFWETLSNITNVNTYRNFIDKKVVPKYIEWVKSVEPTYSNAENDDMRNFCIGAFGEIFFNCLLTNINSLLVSNEMYHFQNVVPVPLKSSEHDFGVDAVCTYSVGVKEKDCAIQIKFWNPFAGTTLNMSVIQGVFGQAVAEELIKPEETKNVIICWLSTDNEVSSFLKENKALYRHVVFIDAKTLNQNINNQVPFFWRDILPKYIKDLL